jgi:hypothetical protein
MTRKSDWRSEMKALPSMTFEIKLLPYEQFIGKVSPLSFEPSDKLRASSRPLHPKCPPGVLSISLIVKTADGPARRFVDKFNCEDGGRARLSFC